MIYEMRNLITGLGGIEQTKDKVTPVSPAAWIWILNIILLLLGFLFLGRQNGFKTVYCSMFYSAFTYILEVFTPITEPFTNQLYSFSMNAHWQTKRSKE